MNQAIWGATAGLLTVIIVSYCTKPPNAASLVGLVWTKEWNKSTSTIWYKSVWAMAAVVMVIFFALNFLFR